MCVVFHTETWYVCVFKTCSTSYSLYNTLMDPWNVCMYMYIYICVCVRVYIYIYTYIYIYILHQGLSLRPSCVPEKVGVNRTHSHETKKTIKCKETSQRTLSREPEDVNEEVVQFSLGVEGKRRETNGRETRYCYIPHVYIHFRTMRYTQTGSNGNQ